MTPPRFQRIGVVGAGVIGTGVAQLFAQTGHDVVLLDIRDDQLSAAKREIAKNIKLYHLLRKSPDGPCDPLSRLHCTDATEDLADTDFVIENITEDCELKRRVHRAIDAVIDPAVPVAANASAIPITRIAARRIS